MNALLRFAPSPHGFLHIGHAYSLYQNMAFAEKLGGTVLIRIDDLDRARSQEKYINTLIEDLRWLGLKIEEPLYYQSHHYDTYKTALQTLCAQGLLYQADRSRREIIEQVKRLEAESNKPWPRDPDGAPFYPFYKQDRSKTRWCDGVPMRLNMKKAIEMAGDLYWNTIEGQHIKAEPSMWGDVLLARRDCPSSYHLSVVVDDQAMKITHCVRGQDLRLATHIHCLIAHFLKLKLPLYHHHKILKDKKGNKLSKSEGATPLYLLRERNLDAEHIKKEYLAFSQ